jgi:general secretion pathway protein N
MKWVLLLLGALALAIAFLPLRLATAYLAPGLAADGIEGSIWNGRLRNARYAGLPLGDLDVGLDPRRLPAGEASLGFTRLQPRLSGRVGGTRQARRIEQLTGELQLAVLPPPVPAATVAFDGAFATLGAGGKCLSAGGTVSARLSGIPLLGETPPLAGTPRCDGDALFAPLVAPGGEAGLDRWLWPDSRWQAGLNIRNSNPLALLAMGAAGFSITDQGGTYRVEGRLRPGS